MLFQQLCIEKTHWDSPLSESHKRKYLKLISETEELNKIRVKRALQSSKAVPINQETHSFSDASESAISAVAYLRTTYSEFGPDVRLIASKRKVAPLVKQIIPKLELIGVGLLACLIHSVAKRLPFATTNCFWTDSMTTLAWIKITVHGKCLSEIKSIN